jgi:hypothetical protein
MSDSRAVACFSVRVALFKAKFLLARDFFEASRHVVFRPYYRRATTVSMREREETPA